MKTKRHPRSTGWRRLLRWPVAEFALPRRPAGDDLLLQPHQGAASAIPPSSAWTPTRGSPGRRLRPPSATSPSSSSASPSCPPPARAVPGRAAVRLHRQRSTATASSASSAPVPHLAAGHPVAVTGLMWGWDPRPRRLRCQLRPRHHRPVLPCPRTGSATPTSLPCGLSSVSWSGCSSVTRSSCSCRGSCASTPNSTRLPPSTALSWWQQASPHLPCSILRLEVYVVPGHHHHRRPGRSSPRSRPHLSVVARATPPRSPPTRLPELFEQRRRRLRIRDLQHDHPARTDHRRNDAHPLRPARTDDHDLPIPPAPSAARPEDRRPRPYPSPGTSTGRRERPGKRGGRLHAVVAGVTVFVLPSPPRSRSISCSTLQDQCRLPRQRLPVLPENRNWDIVADVFGGTRRLPTQKPRQQHPDQSRRRPHRQSATSPSSTLSLRHRWHRP